MGKQDNRVILAGEWVTMATVMVIFWANFVRGTIQALNPEIYLSSTFTIVFSVIVGTVAGSFLGRSLRIIHWNRSSGGSVPL